MQEKFSPELLYKILRQLTDGNELFIGFSGGVDSLVLLHSLWQLRNLYSELNLTAIHVNHGLSNNAEIWVRYSEEVTAALEIPLLIKNVNAKIKIADNSPEEIARKLRYQAFAENLPEGASLLTAHHGDDQAETLLLQLFRGAGPKGLAAMPEVINFAKGKLLRPLLRFSRASLVDYAKEQNLKWIEDESNLNLGFDRNFLRHSILPAIKKRWPGVLQTMHRASRHCADADKLLEVLARDDLAKVEGTVKNTLSIKKLLLLDEPRCCNVLRYWLQNLKLSIPSTAKMQQILRTILTSRLDATPLVSWSGVEIRRYQDNIYAMSPLPTHDNKLQLSWDLTKDLVLPNNLGTLRVTMKDANLDYHKSNSVRENQNLFLSPSSFTVRFRNQGEVCKFSKQKITHSLKKLFQKWQIPPWQRDRIPLIFKEDKLLVVVGYAYLDSWDKRVLINLE